MIAQLPNVRRAVLWNRAFLRRWRPDPGEEMPPNASESYYCVVVARTT